MCSEGTAGLLPAIECVCALVSLMQAGLELGWHYLSEREASTEQECRCRRFCNRAVSAVYACAASWAGDSLRAAAASSWATSCSLFSHWRGRLYPAQLPLLSERYGRHGELAASSELSSGLTRSSLIGHVWRTMANFHSKCADFMPGVPKYRIF